jgi:hypothetical protein
MAAKCWYLFVVAANISDRTYVDGRDNTFSRGMYDECGSSSGGPGNNEYYNGFVAGCLSVRGNTAAACEKAIDS